MAESTGGSSVPRGWRIARLRVTPGSIGLLMLAIGAAIVFRGAFIDAHRQIGWAFASVIVAALLLPFADFLDKYVPRWLALLTTMISLAIVSLGIYVAIVLNVRDGVATLEGAAPSAAEELEAKYQIARDFRLVERVNALIENVKQPSGGEVVGRAVGTAGTYFVCGILTLFFLVYGPKMLRAAFAQVTNTRRRIRAERIVLRTLKNARKYIFAMLAQGVVVGTVVGTVAWVLDLPAPFVLGFIAGAIGMVPTLGIVVGGLPALLLAAGVGGVRDGWIMALVLVGLQALEVWIVRRRVDHKSVHMGPALPAIVALVGYELYGFGGAVFGVIALVFVLAWMDSIGLDDTPLEEDSEDEVNAPSTPAGASAQKPAAPR